MDCSKCKDCRVSGLSVRDPRHLYSPPLKRIGNIVSSSSTPFISPHLRKPRCAQNCGAEETCCERYKQYWSKNCDIPCIQCYEEQPWFRDPVIQKGWGDFVGQYVTPSNICCQLSPGPNDCSYKCNKVRALMGPQVCCVWDLPCQDECCPTRYGQNRDWRRYNEDQRMKFSDFPCDCSEEPACPKTQCEWPPYMGKTYGPRYMAWAHHNCFMYPRPIPFKYQSMKCYA